MTSFVNPFADTSTIPGAATLKSAFANTAFFRAVAYKSALESSTARYVAQRTANGVVKRLDHPVTRLLSRKMNAISTPNQTLATAITHRESTGNGYLRIRRRDDGSTSLVAWNPYDVVPFLFDDQKFFYVTTERRAYLADEFIHLMGFSIDGVVGLSPLELFCQTFNLHATLNRYVVRYFKRDFVASGVIQCPAGVTLTPDQHKTASEDLASFSLASNGDRSVPFLPYGLTWQNIVPPSNEHTKLIETIDATERQICQATGLPPAVLFASGASGKLEEINRDVVMTVLRTDFENMEAAMSASLLTEDEIEAGYYVSFNEQSLLRGDSRRIDQLIKEVNAGTLTANEYRREQDLPDIAGGDTPRMPVSVSQPISEGGADNAPDTTKQETGGTGGAQTDTFAREVIL